MKFFIKMLASVFGLGHLPWAPGTWGSLGGLAVWYFFLHGAPTYIYVAIVVLVSALSCYIAGLAEKAYGEEDCQHIVIDELCGVLVSMIGINVGFYWGFYWGFAGFVLFRFFDILKPFPVRYFEKLPWGIGVVADDLMAGVYVCIILNLGRYFIG